MPWRLLLDNGSNISSPNLITRAVQVNQVVCIYTEKFELVSKTLVEGYTTGKMIFLIASKLSCAKFSSCCLIEFNSSRLSVSRKFSTEPLNYGHSNRHDIQCYLEVSFLCFAEIEHFLTTVSADSTTKHDHPVQDNKFSIGNSLSQLF